MSDSKCKHNNSAGACYICWHELSEERDRLRAELDALRKQEPVGEIVDDDCGYAVIQKPRSDGHLNSGTLVYLEPVPPAELRELCAAAYQVVGAAGGPNEMLDNLSDAACGMQLRHDPSAGLPWSQPVPPAAVAAVPENVQHVLADLDDMASEGWMECARAAGVVRGLLATPAPVAQKVPDGLCEVLSDLINTAESAMHEANRDGAGYDVDAWLAPARAMLAAAQAQEGKP